MWTVNEELVKVYRKLLKGQYSRKETLELLETEFPLLRNERLKCEAQMYLWCLKKALDMFNNKGFDCPDWMYFVPEDGKKVTTIEVYEWFQKLAEKYYKEI